jgi:hypothetical protein
MWDFSDAFVTFDSQFWLFDGSYALQLLGQAMM